MPVHGHPDFLPGLRMDEELVTALAAAFLHETRGLSFRISSFHVTENSNLAIGLAQMVHSRGGEPG